MSTLSHWIDTVLVRHHQQLAYDASSVCLISFHLFTSANPCLFKHYGSWFSLSEWCLRLFFTDSLGPNTLLLQLLILNPITHSIISWLVKQNILAYTFALQSCILLLRFSTSLCSCSINDLPDPTMSGTSFVLLLSIFILVEHLLIFVDFILSHSWNS